LINREKHYVRHVRVPTDTDVVEAKLIYNYSEYTMLFVLYMYNMLTCCLTQLDFTNFEVGIELPVRITLLKSNLKMSKKKRRHKGLAACYELWDERFTEYVMMKAKEDTGKSIAEGRCG
jgi:hypothetical protein